ncbi:unnamed protein product [Enterobius vermicularis]|uniref:Uncharacterized protein n=1 Tax=Enterobius vermicularis TaxID=51028 RepID=A0A0N4VRE0_ENTVE|nr:unnamed protein product [Enterobius vermicularis]
MHMLHAQLHDKLWVVDTEEEEEEVSSAVPIVWNQRPFCCRCSTLSPNFFFL